MHLSPTYAKEAAVNVIYKIHLPSGACPHAEEDDLPLHLGQNSGSMSTTEAIMCSVKLVSSSDIEQHYISQTPSWLGLMNRF